MTFESLGCQLAVLGSKDAAKYRMTVRIWNSILREATTGFEPVIAVLQTAALPLGYVAGSRGEAWHFTRQACIVGDRV